MPTSRERCNNTTQLLHCQTTGAPRSRQLWLQTALGITPQQLLEESNRDTLVKVLSYHVIPNGAVLSSQLQNGQQLTTALADAAPLTVNLKDGKVTFQGGASSATVAAADIKAGRVWCMWWMMCCCLLGWAVLRMGLLPPPAEKVLQELAADAAG
ncbi:hypothetical protein COO60DRAFT_1676428 [Scenedesmus sp. NREL 46B-D3]|nr:hypothetical protein COO60DRAFT_1676428 [Scenedesmus sp. NREL 46B-D3]